MTIFLLAIFAFCSASQAANSYGVGQRNFVFKDSVRERTLSTHVWYPTDIKNKPAPAESDSPFLPVTATEGAMLAKAPAQGFPIVLVSHGSGGKADRLYWLTEHFVKNGIVVLGVDHQGNMTGDNSADGMLRVWDRPKDLSLALDRLLDTPEFRSSLDQTKISAIGHSAGGTTVLLLGGARLSSNTFRSPIPACAGTKDPYLADVCRQMKKVDFRKYPQATVEGDYWDARLKSVVALDPGFAKAFQPASLMKMHARPLVLVADRLNAPQDEIHSREFMKLIPAGGAEVVPNSIHMTFLQPCKPDFSKNDAELKELCADNDQKLRIQAEVAEKSLNFFRQSWNLQAE